MNKYAKTKQILNAENQLSYYLLGAFITDGNVHKDKSRTNSFKCSLHSKDKEWLDSINHILDQEGKIRVGKTCHSLWFYNQDIYQWLISHNCTPNKSLTVQLPNVPNIYFRDFVRGCLDGDGCITRGNYKGNNGKTYEQTTV